MKCCSLFSILHAGVQLKLAIQSSSGRLDCYKNLRKRTNESPLVSALKHRGGESWHSQLVIEVHGRNTLPGVTRILRREDDLPSAT
jgi:hypothetical protein